ncbi:hypothetical protein BBJ28_00017720 [Nothophytophthora sp. Chile5]|nr:hypothetical protein BBJ28_00017720 [Nothophytophthora sp. Chile5]
MPRLMVQADVELVFANAITYNSWESAIGGLVQDLQNYCVKFLLDASGSSRQAQKPASSRKKTGRPVGRPPGSKSRTAAATPGKQRARRHPAATVSYEDEDEEAEASWHSSVSESEEDDEEEDEELSSAAESDWSGAGKKRQLRRPSRAATTTKKAKRRH